jgi:hypothetical protein
MAGSSILYWDIGRRKAVVFSRSWPLPKKKNMIKIITDHNPVLVADLNNNHPDKKNNADRTE